MLYDSAETKVSALVPGVQIPERGVIADPRIGQFGCCHERVVLHVLLGVADQTDAQTKTGTLRTESQTRFSLLGRSISLRDVLMLKQPSGPHYCM